MIGALLPHRLRYPRWCDQCVHPSIARYTKARWIWRRPGQRDVYLCSQHAEEVRTLEQ